MEGLAYELWVWSSLYFESEPVLVKPLEVFRHLVGSAHYKRWTGGTRANIGLELISGVSGRELNQLKVIKISHRIVIRVRF